MLLLGNDIVDLKDPRTTQTHPRFNDRVFTEAEQRTILAAPDPHLKKWELWAGKEAAYKALSRFGGLEFVPKNFAHVDGTVRYQEHQVPITVEHTEEYVHVVAGKNVLWDIADAKGYPKRAVRYMAAKLLEPEAPEFVVFSKIRGVPFARDDSGIMRAVSFSHHGKWAAAAIQR